MHAFRRKRSKWIETSPERTFSIHWKRGSIVLCTDTSIAPRDIVASSTSTAPTIENKSKHQIEKCLTRHRFELPSTPFGRCATGSMKDTESLLDMAVCTNCSFAFSTRCKNEGLNVGTSKHFRTYVCMSASLILPVAFTYFVA